MDIREKGLHHIWQAQIRGICGCLHDFFKGLSLAVFPILKVPALPPLWLHRVVGHEGVVRDLDSAESCISQKLSNLPEGLRGWNETYSLFPLRAKPVLPLGQMKANVFDSVLANLGLFPRDFISCLP
jgi:hypothetical protein